METRIFYTTLASYYDRIYHYINYPGQVTLFLQLIKKYCSASRKEILDVACGTGIHANLLQKRGFRVTGVDSSEDMLKEARKKNKQIRFLRGDMRELSLTERFGIIICIFNAILYNKNKEELKKLFHAVILFSKMVGFVFLTLLTSLWE